MVVQAAAPFNRSRLRTIVVVAATRNLRLAAMPGNVFLPAAVTGIPKDSVANVTQVATLDRVDLESRVGEIPAWLVADVARGLRRGPGAVATKDHPVRRLRGRYPGRTCEIRSGGRPRDGGRQGQRGRAGRRHAPRRSHDSRRHIGWKDMPKMIKKLHPPQKILISNATATGNVIHCDFDTRAGGY